MNPEHLSTIHRTSDQNLSVGVNDTKQAAVATAQAVKESTAAMRGIARAITELVRYESEKPKTVELVGKEAIVEEVLERIPTPQDGRDGVDGTDGKDGADGVDGAPGRDGVDGKDGTDGKDGKDGSPDTPEEIVEKLTSIKKDKKKLPLSAIQGIKEFREGIASEAFRGGTPKVRIYNASTLVSEHVTSLSFGTGVTATYAGNGRIEVTATVTAAWTYDVTPTGTVNGVNTVFTLPVSASQVVVYADGVRVKPSNYTHVGETVTFVAGQQPFSTVSIDYTT